MRSTDFSYSAFQRRPHSNIPPSVQRLKCPRVLLILILLRLLCITTTYYHTPSLQTIAYNLWSSEISAVAGVKFNLLKQKVHFLNLL